MVIISPHIETAPHPHDAHVPDAQQSAVQQAVSPQSAVQKLKPEKSALGVFAKILAGLQIRGPQKNPGTAVPDEAAAPAGSGKPEAGNTKAARNKGARAEGIPAQGITADSVKTQLLKKHDSGEVNPENHENTFFGIERLIGKQPEGAEDGGVPENEIAKILPGNEKQAKTAFPTLEAEDSGRTVAATAGTVAATTDTVAATTAEKKPVKQATPVETAENGKTGKTAEASLKQAEVRAAPADRKEGQSRLEEMRNKRRAAQLDARELRGTETVQENRSSFVPVKAGADIRQVSLELRLPNGHEPSGQESSRAVTSWETKAGYAFEDMLARELHQNFNNDIVRHASVILREGNEGIIKLSLKPESLGNVKIRLELAENKITGHIVVESEEALRAFEREIADLEKAFQEAGFEAAELEMSLAADGRGAEQWQDAEASQVQPWNFFASRYDAATEIADAPSAFDFYRQGTGIVNILA